VLSQISKVSHSFTPRSCKEILFGALLRLLPERRP
jgi:hypothetical protein